MNNDNDGKIKLKFGENGVPSFSGAADMFKKIEEKKRERERKAKELLDLQLENAWRENERLKTAPTIQEQREQILKKLLTELQSTKPDINLQSLPYSRADMLKMLEEYELFNGLSNSQFDDFFTEQKLCKLRRGRPVK